MTSYSLGKFSIETEWKNLCALLLNHFLLLQLSTRYYNHQINNISLFLSLPHVSEEEEEELRDSHR